MIARNLAKSLTLAPLSVAMLAALGGMSPAPSHADPMFPLAPACEKYQVNGGMIQTLQDNGISTTVSWSGSNAVGRPFYTVGGGAPTYGTVTGGVKNRGTFDFTVNWDEGPGAGRSFHYTGEVGADGIARGSMFDSKGPLSSWETKSPLTCIQAAPPPPAPAPAPAQAPAQAPAPKPLQGPGVSWDPRIGGLTAHINDRSGVASQCTYKSDFYERSFFLPANSTFDLVIVPAIPKFQNWDVSITCDNGTQTQTSTFF
jgi:hypothetical protein